MPNGSKKNAVLFSFDFVLLLLLYCFSFEHLQTPSNFLYVEILKQEKLLKDLGTEGSVKATRA